MTEKTNKGYTCKFHQMEVLHHIEHGQSSTVDHGHYRRFITQPAGETDVLSFMATVKAMGEAFRLPTIEQQPIARDNYSVNSLVGVCSLICSVHIRV